MKKLLTFAIATLVFASCNQTTEQKTESDSSNDAVTELIMSRRSVQCEWNWHSNEDGMVRLVESGRNDFKRINKIINRQSWNNQY